jgi:hypothetical protein
MPTSSAKVIGGGRERKRERGHMSSGSAQCRAAHRLSVLIGANTHTSDDEHTVPNTKHE